MVKEGDKVSIILKVLRKLGFKKNSSKRYHWPLIVLMLLLFFGAFGIVYSEQGVNEQFESISDGIWWVFVTITTVGYGDKYPVTFGGRIVALVVMLGGIGTFAYLAGALLEDLLKKGKGIMAVKFKGHYVICNYSFKVKNIIEELLTHNGCCKIVLIADREENPFDQEVSFIKGDSSDENVLKKANITEAKTVIILADGKMEEKLADAHSVLSTLAVRHLNPGIEIIAEVLDPTNYQHFIRAGANDIISSGEITSSLIVRASLYGSGSKAIRELITSRFGNEVYDIIVKDEWVGKKYEETFSMMRTNNYLPIGLAREDKIVTNPPNDTILKNTDKIIYIAGKSIAN